ncbi:hypothetical protein LTR28_004371 [Elasticomyces elasticus]|nr:hypothetical protein LTR28_004371 [Elasticomyces elasticus]
MEPDVSYFASRAGFACGPNLLSANGGDPAGSIDAVSASDPAKDVDAEAPYTIVDTARHGFVWYRSIPSVSAIVTNDQHGRVGGVSIPSCSATITTTSSASSASTSCEKQATSFKATIAGTKATRPAHVDARRDSAQATPSSQRLAQKSESRPDSANLTSTAAGQNKTVSAACARKKHVKLASNNLASPRAKTLVPAMHAWRETESAAKHERPSKKREQLLANAAVEKGTENLRASATVTKQQPDSRPSGTVSSMPNTNRWLRNGELLRSES